MNFADDRFDEPGDYYTPEQPTWNSAVVLAANALGGRRSDRRPVPTRVPAGDRAGSSRPAGLTAPHARSSSGDPAATAGDRTGRPLAPGPRTPPQNLTFLPILPSPGLTLHTLKPQQNPLPSQSHTTPSPPPPNPPPEKPNAALTPNVPSDGRRSRPFASSCGTSATRSSTSASCGRAPTALPGGPSAIARSRAARRARAGSSAR